MMTRRQFLSSTATAAALAALALPAAGCSQDGRVVRPAPASEGGLEW